ncbi:MAG: hypothetical protein K0R22_2557, partial [Sporomusa sp.]|jgi:hypothetical protein|nr:hypothetical protein [Sporomusa sp.]
VVLLLAVEIRPFAIAAWAIMLQYIAVFIGIILAMSGNV